MTSADTQSCTAKMAQPEPEVAGPTDEELADTYWDAWHKHLDRTNSVLHSVGLRAVLARYGHQPEPPAEAEQRHPAPVPVSERPWEREGWCDDEDRCWCMSSLDGPPPRWWLVRPEPLSDGWVLPATALPVPQGESQP